MIKQSIRIEHGQEEGQEDQVAGVMDFIPYISRELYIVIYGYILATANCFNQNFSFSVNA